MKDYFSQEVATLLITPIGICLMWNRSSSTVDKSWINWPQFGICHGNGEVQCGMILYRNKYNARKKLKSSGKLHSSSVYFIRRESKCLSLWGSMIEHVRSGLGIGSILWYWRGTDGDDELWLLTEKHCWAVYFVLKLAAHDPLKMSTE